MFRPSELIITAGGTVEINGRFDCFTGGSIVIGPGAKLSVASGGFNVGVRVSVFNELTIGNNSYVSEYATIRDSDNHPVFGGSNVVSAPITLGNNVLIGINTTILKGVTIGDGSVVAAGAVVTRSAPPNTLVGGVPAKVIRENLKWQI